MLSQAQQDILDRQTEIVFDKTLLLSLTDICQLTQCDALRDESLLQFLKLANLLYRAGEPIISDQAYDHVFLAELQKRHPEHPFLKQVEPEPAFTEKTVKLPVVMLSTDKAYDRESIEKWLGRVNKAAEEQQLDFASLTFRVTPKLDGYAAYDDGERLYTRGDGRKGTDISRVFQRGLQVAGDGKRGHGAGEIVTSKSYFQKKLADAFENARNFQASIIKEKELDEHAQAAIKEGAAVFYPFSQLPDWQGSAQQLLDQFEVIIQQIREQPDFDVDGVILEVTHQQLKDAMGATRHHHRWQIAFKNNLETKSVRVLEVKPQTSRSGRVNPVAELQATYLSGALISRATAHHYGMVKELGIGAGALIELTRSGLVIPKIERVIEPAEAQIPELCPSCQSRLFWDSDYLYCPNTTTCPAQIENSIEHFFKTLANVDGFGSKTVQKLHSNGVKSVNDVYQLQLKQLQTMGFGDKTAQNLLDQLQRSRSEAIEDWRFLGAFGIHRMGLGNCERLLQHHTLAELMQLTVEEIVRIEGFAEKTAEGVISSLQQIADEFKRVYDLGFNLITTPLVSEATDQQAKHPISGKIVVFTGAMQQGSRDAMKKEAKQLGAKVAASVTGKTDYLIAGDKTGAAKLQAAREKGVTVLTEQQYLALKQGEAIVENASESPTNTTK